VSLLLHGFLRPFDTGCHLAQVDSAGSAEAALGSGCTALPTIASFDHSNGEFQLRYTATHGVTTIFASGKYIYTGGYAVSIIPEGLATWNATAPGSVEVALLPDAESGTRLQINVRPRGMSAGAPSSTR